ncbi:MAG: T9SS type A sorting domain-containing protein [Bacteroidales bacterium]|nr:T9SS type A sorting domain-containing protein [Bacteroidales bacterium]
MPRAFFSPALILLLWILLSLNSYSQTHQYFFSEVGQTREYLSSGFCKTQNYYWDQGVMDREGNIYFVFVDNYNLYYHRSDDNGLTWTEQQLTTPQDGKIFTAMVALTQDDSLVITYAANQGFSNGTVSFGSEFIYDLYGAVQSKDAWTITPLKMHTNNSGLLPFGTITTKSGLVHVILHKYGWYNYGGELYEVMYDPGARTWSAIETIKIFNDRPVDRGTNYLCKLAEGQNDTIICVYQRHADTQGLNNIEVIKKGAGGWTEPEIILGNSDYSTYNRFDLDYDRHGHFYLGYFIPFGPDGPELHMAHNSTTDFTKYEIFASTDTLQKMSIHPYPDAEAYVYLNFKDSLPEILKLNQEGLNFTNYLPAFEAEDSLDVMRFLYQINMKNNFSGIPGLFAFTNRYQGRDINTVYSYPLVFATIDLAAPYDPTGIGLAPEFSVDIYPNPAGDYVTIRFPEDHNHGTLKLFDLMGRCVLHYEVENNASVSLSNLQKGLYLYQLSLEGIKQQGRLIRK